MITDTIRICAEHRGLAEYLAEGATVAMRMSQIRNLPPSRVESLVREVLQVRTHKQWQALKRKTRDLVYPIVTLMVKYLLELNDGELEGEFYACVRDFLDREVSLLERLGGIGAEEFTAAMLAWLSK